MFPSREGEQPPDPGFYEKLRQHLTQIVFDQRVSDLCEPLYWRTYLDTNVRIPPVVYFKMLMVGFLENLSSERAIAARCSEQPLRQGASWFRFQRGYPRRTRIMRNTTWTGIARL
jgi:hypothetical protein